MYSGPHRDDACHTFFTCERWTDERTKLEADIDRITPENIVAKMLSSDENWNAVAIYVEAVSHQKNREEILDVVNSARSTSVTSQQDP